MASKIQAALQEIAANNDGILRPEIVVEAARAKTSPLHSSFEWDNTRAAEAHRLWQARQLIVSVTIKYTTFPVGIEDANMHQTVLSNAYPNPAGANAGFSYSMSTGSQGAILVRDILGAPLQRIQLQAASGKVTLNTTNLGDGVYFYSLSTDGKTDNTKKLIIRH